MDELSNQEQKAVEDLRGRMKTVLKQDMYEDIWLFYRFLKARDFDVDEAEKMLRKHVIWRKALQVDTILEDFAPKEILRKYVDISIIGFDKDGDIVLYLAKGKINTAEILNCVTRNYYKKYIIWLGENVMSYMKKHNENVEHKAKKVFLIVDLDELSFGNTAGSASLEIALFSLNHYQNNYPEYLKAMIVINAPSYYVIGYSVLKTVLSNATIRKISIFGSSKWKEFLLNAIDANVLPAFLGGNRTDADGDPLCKSFICHGGKIPSIHYLSNEERYFKDRNQVTKVIIPSMKKEEICVEVRNPGSKIEWEFYCSNDIGFGLFYQASEQELVEVIPVVKYSTKDGAEKNSYKARNIGKYIVVFDNTFSWLNSKEIEYCIDVVLIPN